jgi:hypothetical protein
LCRSEFASAASAKSAKYPLRSDASSAAFELCTERHHPDTSRAGSAVVAATLLIENYP